MPDVLTLDAALQAVADASFYEDKRVIPVVPVDAPHSPIGYVVEDDYAHASDDWTWTYADGVHDRDSVSEASRLMEPYEGFALSAHIRYNLDGAVEQLESGSAVTFAYAIVYDADVTWDDERQEHFDSDGHPADDIAGWILVALWED